MRVIAGNGWAAAGMLRVLGTLKSSAFSQDFRTEICDLGNWTAEIHSAMYPYLVRVYHSRQYITSPRPCAASQRSVHKLRR
jgi:hypothetical protein